MDALTARWWARSSTFATPSNRARHGGMTDAQAANLLAVVCWICQPWRHAWLRLAKIWLRSLATGRTSTIQAQLRSTPSPTWPKSTWTSCWKSKSKRRWICWAMPGWRIPPGPRMLPDLKAMTWNPCLGTLWGLSWSVSCCTDSNPGLLPSTVPVTHTSCCRCLSRRSQWLLTASHL